MSSRPAALAVLVVLTAACGLAQIIGFPGQNPYPQRRNPGGNQIPGRQQQPTTNLVGDLRSISDTAANGNLVIETDDHRTVTVSLEKRTKFVDPSGKNAKITDFQPGDHIEADCTQDNNDNYRATKVTQLRAGTAEERAAASKPANGASAVGGAPDDDNDPDRPRLHRAGEGDANTSHGNSSPGASPDGRPSLLSDNSAGSIDDDSGSGQRRRRAVSSADDRPGAQIPSRGATSDAAANSLPDDGFSGGSSSPQPAFRPSSSDTGRPMLVRNSPPPMPSPVSGPASAAAIAFPPASANPPAYFAKQTITKTQAVSGGPHAASWKPLGTTTSDYIYRPTDEFAAILENVTPPGGAADLRNKREDTIRNHAAWRYDFSVPLARSHWHITTAGQSYSPGYTGAVWIEKGTGNVLRIEASAQDLPDWFPLNLYQFAFDNNLVPLGGHSYLLPSHTDSISCLSTSKACTRSVAEFSDYRVQ